VHFLVNFTQVPRRLELKKSNNLRLIMKVTNKMQLYKLIYYS